MTLFSFRNKPCMYIDNKGCIAVSKSACISSGLIIARYHSHMENKNSSFCMDGWMDDLRVCVLFNSISVISGR